MLGWRREARYPRLAELTVVRLRLATFASTAFSLRHGFCTASARVVHVRRRFAITSPSLRHRLGSVYTHTHTHTLKWRITETLEMPKSRKWICKLIKTPDTARRISISNENGELDLATLIFFSLQSSGPYVILWTIRGICMIRSNRRNKSRNCTEYYFI